MGPRSLPCEQNRFWPGSKAEVENKKGNLLTELVLTSPRARGLFVLTAHPEGCRVRVEEQLKRAGAAFEKPLAAAAGREVGTNYQAMSDC